METINDYNRYTQLMRNGFYDKLFFIDKLFQPWNSILDFGCADGYQTKLIAEIFPDKQVMGYDYDLAMINRAKFTGSNPGNIHFTNDMADEKCDAVFLSSVIHEVYSYSEGEESIKHFWRSIFKPTRKYVIIRDMMYTRSYNNYLNKTLIEAIQDYCRNMSCYGEFNRFQEAFGQLSKEDMLPIIHFLLKLPYIHSPNWERELHEDYLPVSMTELLQHVPVGWKIEHQESYTLPYLKHWWKKNLGVDVPYHTHGKLIIYNEND